MDINWYQITMAFAVVWQWTKKKAGLVVNVCKQALKTFWERVSKE